MDAVHAIARQMQTPEPAPGPQADAAGEPLLENLLPWPDTPRLSPADRERLAATLRIERAGLPEELSRYVDDDAVARPGTPLYDYLRARGLTHLRHRLNARADVRICLGGNTSASAGRYPGVIEEALLAVRDGTPLYLAGLLGGATRQVIDAIRGEPMPDAFCPPTKVAELYDSPPDGIVERDERTRPDREVDRRAVWSAFREAGVGGLSRANMLTEDENEQLFDTPVLDRVVQLTLVGLSRFDGAPRRRMPG